MGVSWVTTIEARRQSTDLILWAPSLHRETPRQATRNKGKWFTSRLETSTLAATGMGWCPPLNHQAGRETAELETNTSHLLALMASCQPTTPPHNQLQSGSQITRKRLLIMQELVCQSITRLTPLEYRFLARYGFIMPKVILRQQLAISTTNQNKYLNISMDLAACTGQKSPVSTAQEELNH